MSKGLISWMVLASGCNGTDTEPDDTSAPDSDTADTDSDGCVAEVLEDDFLLNLSAGEQGDPVNWGPMPPTAIVAMTYLRLASSDEARTAFDGAVQGVVVALSAPAPGLMGVSTGTSEGCRTARTLTVWQDEASLFGFVAGDAHVAAMAQTSVVSRGGSITADYRVSELPAVDWASVAARFADHEGPVY